jgi:hypothetical protein
VKDEPGGAGYLSGIMLDITKRKQAEARAAPENGDYSKRSSITFR